MLNFHLSYKWLKWTRPTGTPEPLPAGVERHFVLTPSGPIEVLYAAGQGAKPGSPPIFFCHGGMGSAWVWLEYMQFLAAHGVTSYAVSLRGHGNSWHPSYLRMVFATPKRALADDLVAAIRWAEKREDSEVVLAGHSSGGGLSQFILTEGDVKVKALCLLGAVPGFGSLSVYINWWRLDPLFTIRMILQFYHPNSPLSHPALIKAVFFSDAVSDAYLTKFHEHSNAYESYLWPFGMMSAFANPRAILQQITGWGASSSPQAATDSQRVLVLTGSGDRIMTPNIMVLLADYFRKPHQQLVSEKKIDAGANSSVVKALPNDDGADDNAGQGVWHCQVPVAGHHLQNDVMWEIGAKKLLAFYQQL